MLENSKLIHLEELAKHYSIILPDTSVINETFGMSSDVPDMKERKKVLVERVKLSNTFVRRIDNFPNILFTPGVLKEIGSFNGGSSHEGENIRRRQYGEEVSLILHASRELFKSRNRLAGYIQREGRIIDLNSDETEALENYNQYYRVLVNRYGLSETDFGLLMYGLVVSQTREGCAILSHDIGIHCSWRDLLRSEEGLTPKNFGLFLRIKSDGFQEQTCKGFQTCF